MVLFYKASSLLYWTFISLTGEERGEHSLPPLKYDYKGLEPHISGLIMEIHHTKHHQGYINNLKAAVAKVKHHQGHINNLKAAATKVKHHQGHINNLKAAAAKVSTIRVTSIA